MWEYDKQDNQQLAISVTPNALPLVATQLSLPLTVLCFPHNAFIVGPSPQAIQAHCRLKEHVVHDSNSESEPADNKGSPATWSPIFPHAISTPKSRSSPKRKGKVDPASSRPTVFPL